MLADAEGASHPLAESDAMIYTDNYLGLQAYRYLVMGVARDLESTWGWDTTQRRMMVSWLAKRARAYREWCFSKISIIRG